MLLSCFAAFAQITLYLNDPRGRAGPADQCRDPHCVALLERLQSARHSIDFAVYGFRRQSAIVEALERAVARGVRVRGVVDADAQGRHYYASTADIRRRLPDVRTDGHTDRRLVERRWSWRGTPDCERPEGFEGPLQCLGYDLGSTCLIAAHASREPIVSTGAIMHHKFFVIDGKTVWTGSTNLSDSGTGGYNANLVVTVDDPVVASWYIREFEQMFVHGRYHGDKEPSPRQERRLPDGSQVRVYFSPQDRTIDEAVRPLLRQARRSIDIAVFFLTHKRITADLIAAHRRGVAVRVILDATAAGNGYTKHELLRAAGIEVKVEDWGGKMHAKSALIDGETLVLGSMNWTRAGAATNDENTLIVANNPSMARAYRVWFEALWAAIDPWWAVSRPDPESWSSGTSCTDGVDDDFDHRIDADDPGCSDDPPPLPSLPPHWIVPRHRGEGMLVKGVERGREKLYFPVTHPAYGSRVATRYFCSRQEAEAAGFRRAPRSSPQP